MLAFRYGGLVARWCRMPGLVLTKHGMTVAQNGMGRRLDRWLAKRATIIAVSDQVEGLMSEWSPLGSKNVHYVPNGLDLEPFRRAPSRREARHVLGFHDDERLVGTVGRLSLEKDHATLLEAFARVVRECPAAKLVIVGDGPLRNALQATIRRLGLQDAVLMLGERHDVPFMLAAIDVFVLSSTTEGMPITVLEAMASGLPVVATRVGGVPAVVTHRKTGFLVEPRLADELAASMILLLCDEASARVMGSAGRRRVEQDFDMRITADSYEVLYRTLKQRDVRGTAVTHD